VAAPPPPAPAVSLPGNEPGVFPREGLATGEHILFETRPNLVAFVLPGALVLLFFALAGVVLLALGYVYPFSRIPNFTTVCLALWIFLIAISAIAMVTQYLRYQRTAYAITTRRVMSTTALIGRTLVECPHDRIQNVTLRQGVIERLLGYGSVVFATAGIGGGAFGAAGVGGGPAYSFGGGVIFFAISSPMETKRVVDELIEHTRRAKRVEELQEIAAAMGRGGASPRAVFCAYCGARLPPDARACPSCGMAVP